MLKVQNLELEYGGHTVVTNLNIEVFTGEVVSIIGPNGSGKSSILNAIGRYIEYKDGAIYVDNEDTGKIKIKNLAKKMCTLSQVNSSPSDFSVQDLIYYGRIPHKRWYEQKNQTDEEIVSWAIKQTNLQGYEEKSVAALSGGERQRVWIALALAQKPKLLMLDEPTTYLDICHQIEVLELIKRVNKDLNITVVMVLHDLIQAARYSDKVAVLKRGSVVAYGLPKKVLTEQLIKDVYNVNTYILDDERLGGMVICPLNTTI